MGLFLSDHRSPFAGKAYWNNKAGMEVGVSVRENRTFVQNVGFQRFSASQVCFRVFGNSRPCSSDDVSLTLT